MTALVSDLPVAALKGRLGLPEREAGNLVETLGRLGIGALGELAALSPRLEELPAPAVSLSLRAVGLGPPAAEQMELSAPGVESRRHRLDAALREVRAAQGADSLLKVLPVDGASRVPERRAILTPFPVPGR